MGQGGVRGRRAPRELWARRSEPADRHADVSAQHTRTHAGHTCTDARLGRHCGHRGRLPPHTATRASTVRASGFGEDASDPEPSYAAGGSGTQGSSFEGESDGVSKG